MFFDVCDGIFLNYNWSDIHLKHSLEMAGEKRQHDIYVGVDVFGRGCPGGGGWNTRHVSCFYFVVLCRNLFPIHLIG